MDVKSFVIAKLILRLWDASVRRKLWQAEVHFGQRKLGLRQRGRSTSSQYGAVCAGAHIQG